MVALGRILLATLVLSATVFGAVAKPFPLDGGRVWDGGEAATAAETDLIGAQLQIAGEAAGAPLSPALPPSRGKGDFRDPSKPQHIMSINMCADMLLLQLVEPSRIASVTYLAGRGMREIDPGAADDLRINHGTAEEILAQSPDLILAGDFSTAMTRKVAAQAGAPILEVKSAISFDDIRDITLQVGEAVGEPARAQALVARMDAALAQLAMTAPAAPFQVAVWNGESSPGRGTLENTIVEAAGARNIVAPAAAGVYATIGLEQLLSADPDFMLLAAEDRREPTVLGAAMRHRVIARRFEGRALTYPEAVFRCGVPQSAEAALDLRRGMLVLTERSQ